MPSRTASWPGRFSFDAPTRDHVLGGRQAPHHAGGRRAVPGDRQDTTGRDVRARAADRARAGRRGQRPGQARREDDGVRHVGRAVGRRAGSARAARSARTQRGPRPVRAGGAGRRAGGSRRPRHPERCRPAIERVVTVADVDESAPPGFQVNLTNFEGPFDLLLQLISKHELDITEVALSVVTGEFITYIKGMTDDLEQTTSFLLVASTLLDLKTARLLPQAEVEDEEDLALLEARDLLFARLMQYRAFKQVAGIMADRLARESKRFPRIVTLEPRFADLLPEVLISVGPGELAQLAARAFEDKPVPILSLTHLHAPQVSVREQAHLVVDQLRRKGEMTFRALTADAPDLMTKVARFLAVLELFREGVIAFEQATPLGDLHVRWTGTDEGEIDVGQEFDAPLLGPDDEPVLIPEELLDDTDGEPTTSHDTPPPEPESTDD
ncbi:segregation/condensation protein A [Aeromicrobium sp. SMF47]|nr:segregation/condensation protein A [Aeromicrobium yanjiei]